MEISLHGLKDSYERAAHHLKMELHLSEHVESWEQCRLKRCLKHFTDCTLLMVSTAWSRGPRVCLGDSMLAQITQNITSANSK